MASRKNSRTAVELIGPRLDDLLDLADRLDPPVDAPCTPVEFTRDERLLLAELLRRIVNESLPPLGPRGAKWDRDRDIALFVHSYEGRGAAKAAARLYDITAENAAKIASERKSQFDEWKEKVGIEAVRRYVKLKVLQLTKT